MNALDEALDAIPSRLPAGEAVRVRRRAREGIEEARHALRLAATCAEIETNPAAALAHLVFARAAIDRALGLNRTHR